MATAFTLARILSNIPLSRGGPASVVIFDIHALQVGTFTLPGLTTPTRCHKWPHTQTGTAHSAAILHLLLQPLTYTNMSLPSTLPHSPTCTRNRLVPGKTPFLVVLSLLGYYLPPVQHTSSESHPNTTDMTELRVHVVLFRGVYLSHPPLPLSQQ